MTTYDSTVNYHIIENKPIENKPIEIKPIENKPIEIKPIEIKPIENKPIEIKPIEIKPIENKITEIDAILKKNSINDLEKFIKKRACINNCNICFTYLFHFLQTCGMITTSISASYNYKELLWIGIGLNALASLVSIYEKTNQTIADKMLENIKHIKAGEYIDESNQINIDNIPKTQ